MNRKGQLGQIAFVLITIVGIILTIIMGKVVLNEVDDSLEAGNVHTNESRQVFVDYDEQYPAFDYMIVFIVIGLTIALMITSFFIPSHSVFLVINIIGIFFMVFLAATLSNVYAEVVSGNDVVATVMATGDFDRMEFIMTKLPYFACVIVLLATIVMYAKGRQQ
ncbi:MAG: hypothetical protein KJ847_02445 [Firmicutes bacterium]|nr:hypothetical protein [Bacillota bacterium]